MTQWPTLKHGTTYRYTFVDAVSGAVTHSGTWTVGVGRDSAMAFRAYVMRWTRRGKNHATVVEVAA